MVGGRRHDRLERLIEEVARGERDLASIRDQRTREAVRIALRMHADRPNEPDDAARARMRERVLGSLKPRKATLADGLAAVFELLARPAPYIVRTIATVVITFSFAAAASVASAESLPDDPLYAMKLAGEDLRLALASTSEDRAAVELSIAEHRLAEAQRLAEAGRVDEALVASSSYSEHIARAAAQLAQLESELPTTSALLRQLDARFTSQRAGAQMLAVKLNAKPETASGAEVFATVAASSLAPGRTEAERVAETAANVAQNLAQVAETRAAEAPASTAPRRSDPPRRTDAPRATEAARTAAPRATEAPRATDAAGGSDAPRTADGGRGTGADKATSGGSQGADAGRAGAGEQSKVVEAARRSADEARKAADEAKAPKDGKHDAKDSKDKGGAPKK